METSAASHSFRIFYTVCAEGVYSQRAAIIGAFTWKRAIRVFTAAMFKQGLLYRIEHVTRGADL